MSRNAIPFSKRKLDWLLVAFFVINLIFIAYTVDIESLIIPDPYHFQPPIWPPAPIVTMIHQYGGALDPLVMARPVWWKMAIWLEVLFYGPFYAVAIYAFIRGRDWIRIPAIFYSGMMFAGVFIVLGEEFAGPNATPHFHTVLALNLPFLLIPFLLVYRMWTEHPFTIQKEPDRYAIQEFASTLSQ